MNNSGTCCAAPAAHRAGPAEGGRYLDSPSVPVSAVQARSTPGPGPTRMAGRVLRPDGAAAAGAKRLGAPHSFYPHSGLAGGMVPPTGLPLHTQP